MGKKWEMRAGVQVGWVAYPGPPERWDSDTVFAGLENVTHMYRILLKDCKGRLNRIVLWREMIAVGENGRFLPFQGNGAAQTKI